jgi:hypothetical protein
MSTEESHFAVWIIRQWQCWVIFNTFFFSLTTHSESPLFSMTFRPPRRILPSAKLNSDNAGELELSSHCRAVASASVASARPPLDSPVASSSPLPESSQHPSMDTEDDPTPLPARSSSKRPSLSAVQSLHSSSSIISVTSTTTASSDAPDLDDTPKQKKPKTSGVQDVHSETLINIDDIEDPQTEPLNKTDPTANIKYFFSPVPRISGQPKCMKCDLCT